MTGRQDVPWNWGQKRGESSSEDSSSESQQPDKDKTKKKKPDDAKTKTEADDEEHEVKKVPAKVKIEGQVKNEIKKEVFDLEKPTKDKIIVDLTAYSDDDEAKAIPAKSAPQSQKQFNIGTEWREIIDNKPADVVVTSVGWKTLGVAYKYTFSELVQTSGGLSDALLSWGVHPRARHLRRLDDNVKRLLHVDIMGASGIW